MSEKATDSGIIIPDGSLLDVPKHARDHVDRVREAENTVPPSPSRLCLMVAAPIKKDEKGRELLDADGNYIPDFKGGLPNCTWIRTRNEPKGKRVGVWTCLYCRRPR